VLGRRLQEMEEERAVIVRENAYLQDQIARNSSVTVLWQRALEAGYVTTGTLVFIPVEPIEGLFSRIPNAPP